MTGLSPLYSCLMISCNPFLPLLVHCSRVHWTNTENIAYLLLNKSILLINCSSDFFLILLILQLCIPLPHHLTQQQGSLSSGYVHHLECSLPTVETHMKCLDTICLVVKQSFSSLNGLPTTLHLKLHLLTINFLVFLLLLFLSKFPGLQFLQPLALYEVSAELERKWECCHCHLDRVLPVLHNVLRLMSAVLPALSGLTLLLFLPLPAVQTILDSFPFGHWDHSYL